MSFHARLGCQLAVALFVATLSAHAAHAINLTLLTWAKADGQWVFELIPTYGLSTMKPSEMSEFAAETQAHHGVAAIACMTLSAASHCTDRASYAFTGLLFPAPRFVYLRGTSSAKSAASASRDTSLLNSRPLVSPDI
jgi:hypothetical protein